MPKHRRLPPRNRQRRPDVQHIKGHKRQKHRLHNLLCIARIPELVSRRVEHERLDDAAEEEGGDEDVPEAAELGRVPGRFGAADGLGGAEGVEGAGGGGRGEGVIVVRWVGEEGGHCEDDGAGLLMLC